MSFSSWSVVAGEICTTSKWNLIGSDLSSLNNGSALPTANAAKSTVYTSETYASATFGALATPQAVTTTIGSTGMAFVFISAEMANDTNSAFCIASFVVSGANTIGANDSQSLKYNVNGGKGDIAAGWGMFLTGLTPGSTIFTLQVRVTGGTGTFLNRNLVVIPF